MLESPSNPESVPQWNTLRKAGSTSTPATTTVPSTEATTATTTQTAATITRTGTQIPPAPPPATRARDGIREQQIGKKRCVVMRKTKFSGHSNVDTDIADYDDHYLESLFVGRMKSGIIHLGPDEIASKHKIRVNLQIGTKNTRIIATTRPCVGFSRIVLRPAISDLMGVCVHVATCKDDH